MRKVESCFQRLEQRYALFTPGPARADRYLRDGLAGSRRRRWNNSLESEKSKAKIDPLITNQPLPERIKTTTNTNRKPHKVLPMF
jgi:hypothetical protein